MTSSATTTNRGAEHDPLRHYYIAADAVSDLNRKQVNEKEPALRKHALFKQPRMDVRNEVVLESQQFCWLECGGFPQPRKSFSGRCGVGLAFRGWRR